MVETAGIIEALYALDDDEFAEIAKNHNNNSNALWTKWRNEHPLGARGQGHC